MWLGLLFVLPANASAAFPNCAEAGFEIGPSAVEVEVNPVNFLEDGTTGLVSNHGFEVISMEACSLVCAKATACNWWSLRNESMCTLYNSNGTQSIAGTRTNGTVVTAHSSCSPSTWPKCVTQDVYISSTGYSELWINATALLEISRNDKSCYKVDCHFTDKFRIHSPEQCATVCSRHEHCNYFIVGSEQSVPTCWLRRSQSQNETRLGFVSGSRSCASHAPYSWPSYALDG